MNKDYESDGDTNPVQSNNEEEFNDEYLSDHNYDNEADKNRIVEQSPRGRFIRFNEELGSGAYKTVYKGYDNETGCEIAWNIIKLQRLPSKERKRISDEISLLKQLKHPNIIHFISAWINKQKEEVVFITEIVTGGSLKRYLKKIRSPRLKVIKAWCKEILQGIEYLHNLKPNPIIHRDIKCDNIFINSNKGEIRIGDLGLATCMSNAFADSVLGTPEFMAPEMYEEVYGPSVDVYSFGMCVLEMVTNQTPYRECQNPAQVYKKVIQGIKPEVLNLIANEEVKNFIIECLKPKDERPTAAELLKHKFLLISDSEIDNQPVALEVANNLNTIDEESSLREASKLSEKVPKFYNQAVFEQGLVLEDQKNLYELKSPKEKREDRATVEGSSEKFLKEPSHNSYNNIIQPKPEQLLVQKKLSDHSKISKLNIKSDDNSKSPFNHNAYQKIMRDEEKIKEKSHKKDEIKYHFESRGIHENHLIIVIRLEANEGISEHIIEIQKDKLSQEKIAKKLMKFLSLSNPNDPYFIAELRNLIESLDSIPFNSSSLSSNYLNTATTINQKSVNMIDNNLLQNQLSHFSTSNTAFFQPELFNQFYERYMMNIPKEYLSAESEEAMNSRHQREIMELQSAHLSQKRSLWDKKQNILSYNSNSMYFPGIQSNILGDDDQQKTTIPNEINFKGPTKNKFIYPTDFTISPFSSGTISPNNGNFYSVNNSVENMASLLKKLGNVERNNTTFDEQSKSAIGNQEQYFDNRNNIMSPRNENNINRTPIEKKTFKFPTSTNTSSQNIVNSGLTNIVQQPSKDRLNSPRGTSEKFDTKIEPTMVRQGSDQSYDKAPNKDKASSLPIQFDPPPLPTNRKVNLNSNLLQILTCELTSTLSPSSRHQTQMTFNATSPPLESQIQKEISLKNEIHSPNLPFPQGKYTSSSQKILQNRDENPSLPLKTTINLASEVIQTNNSKPVKAILVRQGSNDASKKWIESKPQQQQQQQSENLITNQVKTQSDVIQMIKNHKMKGNLMIDAPDMDPEDICVLHAALGMLTGHLINSEYHFNERLVKLGQEMAGITPDGVINPISWEKIISN